MYVSILFILMLLLLMSMNILLINFIIGIYYDFL